MGEQRASPPPRRVAVQELPRQEVDRQFYDVRLLASGWYTKVFSARHQRADHRVVLKCVHKGTTRPEDFFREFHYNYYLSPHPNIVTSFHVPFVTGSSFVFALEEAPSGDLSQLVPRGGVGEEAARRVCGQVASALAFMHSKDLVHRDVTLDNVLAFDPDLQLVKLADFGATQQTDTQVGRTGLPMATMPPEVRAVASGEEYAAHPAQDTWQLGLLVVACLTGALPWATADASDPNYSAWEAWVRRASPRLPPRFRGFTPRLLSLLRRLLHPDPERRCGVAEVEQHLTHTWLARDMDPFEACMDASLLEVPETHSLLWKAERKLTTLVRCYVRRVRHSARRKHGKHVHFADVLEERREVERLEEEEDEEECEVVAPAGRLGWEWYWDDEDDYLDYPVP